MRSVHIDMEENLLLKRGILKPDYKPHFISVFLWFDEKEKKKEEKKLKSPNGIAIW